MMDMKDGGFNPGNPKRLVWEEMESRLAVYLRSFSGLQPEDAEEILQRAILALWQSGPSELEDARPWLYRVVRNMAIDILRKKKRRKESALSLEESGLADSARSAHPGPEEEFLSAEERGFVRNFLGSLPRAERELAHLAFAEELPYSRIALITGIPLGTVKWKLAAVKRKLAKSYQRRMA